MPLPNATLRPWHKVATIRKWKGLLIGNGASRAVWPDFHYKSLYNTALTLAHPDCLRTTDRTLFKELRVSHNFEAVLEVLNSARIVCRALGLSTSRIEKHYARIRQSLIAAVHSVHVPWHSVPPSILSAIRATLCKYEHIYSTNYDLLLYWSVMSDTAPSIKDYFWGRPFNVADSVIHGHATSILYLHGGVHLGRNAGGRTVKVTGGHGSTLLSSFGLQPDIIPLFITEGGAKEKLSAIARSDYLTFAYERFARHKGPMVVFGHAFGKADSHLTDAMASWKNAFIAYGVYEQSSNAIVRRKSHVQGLLPSADLLFFDARTHPLGSPALSLCNGS